LPILLASLSIVARRLSSKIYIFNFLNSWIKSISNKTNFRGFKIRLWQTLYRKKKVKIVIWKQIINQMMYIKIVF
jgi:hypothetical protein